MDYGRLNDLETLSHARDRANSISEKEEIERVIDRILRTSAPIRSLREQLLKATRANDRPAIRRIVEHIHYVRQNETSGREIS